MRTGTDACHGFKSSLRRTLALVWLLGPALAPLAACSDEAPEEIESIQLTPGSVTLVAGQTLALGVTVHGASGGTLTDRPITWNSSNAAVAGVDTNGFVTTIAPGITIVMAVCEGNFGSATITVIPIPVVSVVVEPDTAKLLVGQSVQFSAAALDSLGRPLSGRSIAWASGNPAVASVSVTGLATGMSAGAATITASSEGRSGAGRVTVTPRLLTGSWSGTMVSSGISATIDYSIEEAASGEVTGTTRFAGTNFSLTGTVKGTRTGNVVSLTSTFAGFQPYTYVGTVDATANVITGTINGSGFVNQPLRIVRIGAWPSAAAGRAGTTAAVPGSARLIDALSGRSR
jgi:hypothetical protein